MLSVTLTKEDRFVIRIGRYALTRADRVLEPGQVAVPAHAGTPSDLPGWARDELVYCRLEMHERGDLDITLTKPDLVALHEGLLDGETITHGVEIHISQV